jgi:tRNA threonylcarbamoyladenosine biosynthesis protein TsaE
MMRLRLADAAATERLGRKLAAPLVEACRLAPFVVHLEGPLGAGKTTLVRGLLRGLGHSGRVRSPTFTLLEPYEPAGCSVLHLDLYRLSDPGELDFLGLLDLIGAGSLLLVEWPERGSDRLPPADLSLALEYEGESRCACLEPRTAAGRRVVEVVQGTLSPALGDQIS